MRDRIKVSTIAHRLKSTSCSDQSRPHPSGCTLFFPFRGPDIGTHHRHAFIAHWGKAAIIKGKTIPISIDEVDCVIELLSEAMEYIGEKLLGFNHFTEKSESYDPWELNVPGGVAHVIVYLKRYERFSYKYREYVKNGEPFLSPRWFDISNSEEERKKQRERILSLIDT